MASFLAAFIAARAYTILLPHHVLVGGGLHIHHFWFGIALLAVGGWLGIAYSQKEVDIVAAILYGAGGGLIVDEVGLLLTFGDYWSGWTWTFLVVIVIFALVLILFARYRKNIGEELQEFAGSRASLYVGLFSVAISVAFLVETDSFLATLTFGGLCAVGVVLILVFLIFRFRQRG